MFAAKNALSTQKKVKSDCIPSTVSVDAFCTQKLCRCPFLASYRSHFETENFGILFPTHSATSRMKSVYFSTVRRESASDLGVQDGLLAVHSHLQDSVSCDNEPRTFTPVVHQGDNQTTAR